MKKFSLITLLAIPFLAACNNTNTTSPWSNDFQQIMNTNLNENLLPYIELNNITVSYDSLNGSVNITAPNATSEETSSYKNRLLSDGYTEVVVEALKVDYTSKGFHTFSKEVAGGIIYIDLYCLNSYNSYSTSGEFNVNAYYYEILEDETTPLVWTTVDKRIMTTFLESQTLVACDVKDKTVSYDSMSEAVKVSAPHAEESEVTTYVTAMTSAGYTQITTGYESIGFYQVEKTIDSDSKLVVQTYTYHDGINLGTSGNFYIDAFIQTI